MKIVWLCNNNPLDFEKKGGGGWFSSISSYFKTNHDMVFVFPSGENKNYLSDKSQVYTFKYKSIRKPFKYSNRIEKYFEDILNSENPDVVHIWGTEYSFSLAMVNAAKKNDFIDKTFVHIQGLCYSISDHLNVALPNYVYSGKTLKDLYIGSIKRQHKVFQKRGENEIRLLQEVKHVFGRTTWDKANCHMMNDSIVYHFCGESLRDVFYEKKWEYEECEKETIFISQASYSLKGLHVVLKAFHLVTKKHPNSIVYIAGNDVSKLSGGLKDFVLISKYGLYIRKLIKRYNLEKNVKFLGPLDSIKMAEQYKKANVYLISSFMENSPNSLGEAMCVGTPCVASYVGGIPDLVKHGQNGYLYQCDDPYILAYYICNLFENPMICKEMSLNAKKFANGFYDKKEIINNILDAYKSIS